MLIYSIVNKRSLVMTLYSRKEIAIFKKDVRLSIVSIILNILFMSLNFPFAVVLYFLDYSDFLFLMTSNLFYLSYTINYYLFVTMDFLWGIDC